MVVNLYTIYLNNALQFPSICQGISDAFYRLDVTHNLLQHRMKVYQAVSKLPPPLQCKERSSVKDLQKLYTLATICYNYSNSTGPSSKEHTSEVYCSVAASLSNKRSCRACATVMEG